MCAKYLPNSLNVSTCFYFTKLLIFRYYRSFFALFKLILCFQQITFYLGQHKLNTVSFFWFLIFFYSISNELKVWKHTSSTFNLNETEKNEKKKSFNTFFFVSVRRMLISFMRYEAKQFNGWNIYMSFFFLCRYISAVTSSVTCRIRISVKRMKDNLKVQWMKRKVSKSTNKQQCRKHM